MKSVMQEASSIIKAIEQGWKKAGQPKEFSIKIFEKPVKNFIGLTVQLAKIGIFFEEKEVKKEKDIEKRFGRKPKPVRPPVKKKEEKKISFQEKVQVVQKVQKPSRIIWTEPMIQLAQNWIDNVLKIMNHSNVSYQMNAVNYQLHFKFEKGLAPTPEKERQLMRSFAHLLMQALRHKFKRPLRGFKVVLTAKN